MTQRFSVTQEARNGAMEIWERIANDDSEKTANRVISRIYEQCQKLAEQPGLGHYRNDLLDCRYRFWNIWSYLIVYRWEVEPIQVIAIVHGARELNLYFGEG